MGSPRLPDQNNGKVGKFHLPSVHSYSERYNLFGDEDATLGSLICVVVAVVVAVSGSRRGSILTS